MDRLGFVPRGTKSSIDLARLSSSAQKLKRITQEPRKNNEFFVWEHIMTSTAEVLSDMWRNYLICLQKYYKEIAEEYSYGNVVFSVKKDKY